MYAINTMCGEKKVAVVPALPLNKNLFPEIVSGIKVTGHITEMGVFITDGAEIQFSHLFFCKMLFIGEFLIEVSEDIVCIELLFQ
jgi:hypothetical protein